MVEGMAVVGSNEKRGGMEIGGREGERSG